MNDKKPSVARIGQGRRREDRQLNHEFKFPRNYARTNTKVHKVASLLSLLGAFIMALACATGFGLWAYWLATWLFGSKGI